MNQKNELYLVEPQNIWSVGRLALLKKTQIFYFFLSRFNHISHVAARNANIHILQIEAALKCSDNLLGFEWCFNPITWVVFLLWFFFCMTIKKNQKKHYSSLSHAAQDKKPFSFLNKNQTARVLLERREYATVCSKYSLMSQTKHTGQ